MAVNHRPFGMGSSILSRPTMGMLKSNECPNYTVIEQYYNGPVNDRITTSIQIWIKRSDDFYLVEQYSESNGWSSVEEIVRAGGGIVDDQDSWKCINHGIASVRSLREYSPSGSSGPDGNPGPDRVALNS